MKDSPFVMTPQHTSAGIDASSAEKTHSSFIFIWPKNPIKRWPYLPTGKIEVVVSSERLNAINDWTLMGSYSARLPVLLTLIVTMGLGLSAADAQTSSQSVTSGSGQYYVEFRSRQAWDYGHTFVVFGRVGETPGKKNVAGLSPKGDDPKMWVMGHYMPVPADTGWTDGDLEDKVHHFALSGAHQ